MTSVRTAQRAGALLLAALVSGCGGGSHTVPIGSASSAALAGGNGRANFSIVIPPEAKSAAYVRARKATGGRSTAFVSPATKSISVTLAGITTNINTTVGSPGCVSNYGSPSITEIHVNSQPRGMVTGADGLPYFVEDNGGSFGVIQPNNVFSDHPVGRLQNDVIVGPDGYFWIADVYGPYTIGHLSPDRSSYNQFATGGTDVGHLAQGSDGTVWFSAAAVGSQYMYHMDGSGNYQSGDTLVPTQNASYVASGSDHAVYFSEGFSNTVGYIGRVAKTGNQWGLTEYGPTPVGLSADALASDGAIWVTDYNGLVYRFTNAGLMTQPAQVSAFAAGMITGPDGALWAAIYNSNTVARIVPSSGAVQEFPMPTAASEPTGITAGADGSIYVTEQAVDQVARLSFPTACTGVVEAPVGTTTATMTAWDTIGGTGNKLSTQSTLITIAAGSTTNIAFTLDGIVNAATLTALSHSGCSPVGTDQLIFAAFDATGATIVGPGGYIDANGIPLTFTFTTDDNSSYDSLVNPTATSPTSTSPALQWNNYFNSQNVTTAVSGGTIPSPPAPLNVNHC